MSNADLDAPTARAGMTVPLGPGSHLTLKAVGADTDQAFALLEYHLASGGGAGLHTHSREDEAFYVLAGELAVQLGEDALTVAPGEFLRIPRGVRHAFINQGPEPLIALVVLTPAGLEQFFVDLAALGETFDPAQFAALAERYGLDLSA